MATTAGLDWPRTTEIAEQQASLHALIGELKTANFNTVFFQVRARGDAYYRSAYEPWGENLTGTLGKDPGWDPLAFLLAEAHQAGFEVHAWFNVFKIRGPNPVGTSIPLHPSRAHPQWVAQHGGELWFDPGIPEVREYLISVALDIVKNYDVDGINFDFIRYPGPEFPDKESYRRYGNGTPRDEWRRSNISKFVVDFCDRMRALKPMVKLGSSPLGVYRGETEDEPEGSYFSNSQDSRSWLRLGKHDYLAPQVYWNIGASKGNPDFARLARSWGANASGRHIYIGIAAYKADVAKEIPAQIDSSRQSGAAGQAFFRYDYLKRAGLFGGRYDLPGIIPPMNWKDSIPPLAPQELTVTELAPNVFGLQWTPPAEARDGDGARYYVIYRWTSARIPFDNPRAIAAVTTDNRSSYIDTVRVPTGLSYYYAVTAFDKGNNESPPSNVSAGTMKELSAIRGILEVTGLSIQVSNTTQKPTLIAYRLARRSRVSVDVLSIKPAGSDTLVRSIVNEVQEGGTYVFGLNGIPFPRGKHTLRLNTGESHLEQSVDVP